MRTLLLLAVALEAHPVAASCMRAELGPLLLTRRDTHLPADGGVLVGYGAQTGDNREATGPDPSDVKWKASTKLVRTQLAPGLSVYKSDAKSFTFGKGSFTHDGKTTALSTAPAPRKVSVKIAQDFRSTSTTATLTLSAAPPADAVAIIVYDAATTKPILFEGIPDTHDKLVELQIYHAGGHCGSPTPPDEGGVSVASKIVFAWVDAFGRVSPQSKPITAQ